MGRAMKTIGHWAALIFAAPIAIATPALAWGPEGHTIIARVATTHLSAKAATDLGWIVSVGVPALNAEVHQKYGMKCQIDPSNPWGPIPDFVTDKDQHTNLANWADCYRYLDASTAGWHFDDILLGQTVSGPLKASSQAWCVQPAGCVSSAFSDNLRKLANPSLTPADAARALAYVVHFAGDIHQPLHEEDNGDLGGNNVMISTTGSGVSATKLHQLWDTPLVVFALGGNLDAATQALASKTASAPSPAYKTIGAVIAESDGWVEDAHTLAQPAYALLNVPVGAGSRFGVQVTAAYVQTEAPVAEGQLVLAAARLKAALNAALTWTRTP